MVSIDPERLRLAMAEANLDQSGLARAVGCTPGAINQITLGNVERSRLAPDIAYELGVDYEWLIGQDVEKRRNSWGKARLSKEEYQLLDHYRPLRLRDQQALLRITEALKARDERPRQNDHFPSEAALTQMFEGLLAASRRLDEAGLAHELAKRLPIALGALRGPLIEPASDVRDEAPEPAEALASDPPSPRRARRT